MKWISLEKGWHKWFSVALGAGIITMVILRVFYKSDQQGWFVVKLQQWMWKWIHKKNPLSPMFLGMGNGLLPCGMVYLALVSALGRVNSIGGGSFFMVCFGLGTIPALFALSVFGFFFRASLRGYYKRIVPYVSILAGVLLILRGLDLGIPLLSPEMYFLPNHPVSCGK